MRPGAPALLASPARLAERYWQQLVSSREIEILVCTNGQRIKRKAESSTGDNCGSRFLTSAFGLPSLQPFGRGLFHNVPSSTLLTGLDGRTKQAGLRKSLKE